MLKERSTLRKVNQETYALVLKELMAAPCTIVDLEEVAGLHHVTMLDFMRILKRHKVVHIAGWENDSLGRPVFAVFAFGNRPNVKRPSKTRAQIAAAYRVRKQQKLLNQITTGETP